MLHYEYDSDDNSDIELSDFVYDSEEISLTRFNIALCELYNSNMHGPETSEVLTHYLVISRYKKLIMNYIENEAQYNLVKYYIPNYQFNINHELFPNYEKILRTNIFFKPQIVECIDLDSGHSVAIIKTFWIKIIQRTWKTIFKIKKETIQKRKNILSLRNREMTGYWPTNCSYIPSIKGMLYYLKSIPS
jgi:hypothetical protein